MFAQPAAYRDLYLERNALSARALAMGMTGSAVARDNYDAVFINPAALSPYANFSLKSESTLMDVRQFALQATVPLEKDTEFPDLITVVDPVLAKSQSSVGARLSLGYANLAVADIAIADLSGTELTVADVAGYSEQVFLLGYAQQLFSGMQAGVTAKYFKNQLNVSKSIYDQGNATGGDIDVGLLWQMQSLDVGLGYRNVLSALSQDGVLTWDTGVKSSFDHGLFFGMHKNYNRDLEFAVDIFNSRLHTLVYGLGLEYMAIPEFRLRGGYNSLQQFSLGLGLVMNNQMIIDYTYVPDFGTVVDLKHFFSLSWLF